jgi:hypothetical protein
MCALFQHPNGHSAQPSVIVVKGGENDLVGMHQIADRPEPTDGEDTYENFAFFYLRQYDQFGRGHPVKATIALWADEDGFDSFQCDVISSLALSEWLERARRAQIERETKRRYWRGKGDSRSAIAFQRPRSPQSGKFS